MRLVVFIICLIFGTPAVAQENHTVFLYSKVSDEDFYRAIACGAEPGGTCSYPFRRWSGPRQRDLRVALARVYDGYPAQEARYADTALELAIGRINRAGSTIKMRRVAPAAKADINIFLLNTPPNSVVRGTRIRSIEGKKIEAANVTIYWNGANQISRAVIALSHGHIASAHQSIMLEELFQALGFMSDIKGHAYSESTITYEYSNKMFALGEQDKAALRMHYPKSDIN